MRQGQKDKIQGAVFGQFHRVGRRKNQILSPVSQGWENSMHGSTHQGAGGDCGKRTVGMIQKQREQYLPLVSGRAYNADFHFFELKLVCLIQIWK